MVKAKNILYGALACALGAGGAAYNAGHLDGLIERMQPGSRVARQEVEPVGAVYTPSTGSARATETPRGLERGVSEEAYKPVQREVTAAEHVRYGPRQETLTEMIGRHEGKRNWMYPDTKGIPTIGIGFNLTKGGAQEKIESLGLPYREVLKGTVGLTDAQIYRLFEEDLQTATEDAIAYMGRKEFEALDPKAQGILIDMAMMGRPNLMEFKKMKQALEKEDYHEAARQMAKSPWYRQVKSRGKELQQLMKTCRK